MFYTVPSSSRYNWPKNIPPHDLLWRNFYRTLNSIQKSYLQQAENKNLPLEIISFENKNTLHNQIPLSLFQYKFLTYFQQTYLKKSSWPFKRCPEIGIIYLEYQNQILLQEHIPSSNQPRFLVDYNKLSLLLENFQRKIKKAGLYHSGIKSTIHIDHIHPTIEIKSSVFNITNGPSLADCRMKKLLEHHTHTRPIMQVLMPHGHSYNI